MSEPTSPAKPMPRTIAATRCPRSVSTTESHVSRPTSRPTSMRRTRNRIMNTPV